MSLSGSCSQISSRETPIVSRTSALPWVSPFQKQRVVAIVHLDPASGEKPPTTQGFGSSTSTQSWGLRSWTVSHKSSIMKSIW